MGCWGLPPGSREGLGDLDKEARPVWETRPLLSCCLRGRDGLWSLDFRTSCHFDLLPSPRTIGRLQGQRNRSEKETGCGCPTAHHWEVQISPDRVFCFFFSPAPSFAVPLMPPLSSPLTFCNSRGVFNLKPYQGWAPCHLATSYLAPFSPDFYLPNESTIQLNKTHNNSTR